MLNIRATSVDTARPEIVPNPEENTANAALAEQIARWRKKLPKDENKLFGWLMKQDQKTVSDLLVLSTSLTLEAAPARNSFTRDHRDDAAHLSAQLSPDFTMADYWQPTAAGFLSRLTKNQLARALTESGLEQLAERVQNVKRDEATATSQYKK